MPHNRAATAPILGPRPQEWGPAPISITVGDWWQYGTHLRATCSCGADREIPASSVIKLLGAGHHFNEAVDLPRITRALVCGSCGKKGSAIVRLVQP
jgi:hypothetical protein